MHICQLALDLCAVSPFSSMTPCHHLTPNLQCCKSTSGGVDVLHIYELGLDFAETQFWDFPIISIVPISFTSAAP